jgi:alpha-ketoglutarate-dependent taurine dioxygenase
MKIEEINKETILLVSEYVDLYFTHPVKAYQFYMEQKDVIDGVFALYNNQKYYKREQFLKNWMELKNQ